MLIGDGVKGPLETKGLKGQSNDSGRYPRRRSIISTVKWYNQMFVCVWDPPRPHKRIDWRDSGLSDKSSFRRTEVHLVDKNEVDGHQAQLWRKEANEHLPCEAYKDILCQPSPSFFFGRRSSIFTRLGWKPWADGLSNPFWIPSVCSQEELASVFFCFRGVRMATEVAASFACNLVCFLFLGVFFLNTFNRNISPCPRRMPRIIWWMLQFRNSPSGESRST